MWHQWWINLNGFRLFGVPQQRDVNWPFLLGTYQIKQPWYSFRDLHKPIHCDLMTFWWHFSSRKQGTTKKIPAFSNRKIIDSGCMGWMNGWDSLFNKDCKPRQEPESSNVDALCIFKASRSLAQNGGTISSWWLNRFFYFHPETWENNPIWLMFFGWVKSTN